MNALKTSVSVSFLLALMNLQAAEMPARGPIPFSAYDADNNGVISEVEFNTTRQQRMASQASSGGAMRGAASAPKFADFDKDGDGQLTENELSLGQATRRRVMTGMGQGGSQGRGMGMRRNMPVFGDYDLNGDGKLVESEFIEGKGQRIAERAKQGYQMKNLGNSPSFADIDSNGDGAVNQEEFSAHQSRKQQRVN